MGSPSSYSGEDDVDTQRTVTQAVGAGSKGTSDASVVLDCNPWSVGGGGSTLGGRGTVVRLMERCERALLATLCRPAVVVVARVYWTESQASDSTKAKRRSGTGAGLHQRTSKIGRGGMAARRFQEFLARPSGLRSSPPRSLRERVGEERRFWDAIPTVKNLQCAWEFLLQCATPGPHVAHASSKPVRQVRSRPRRRHVGQPWRPFCNMSRRRRGTELCARDRHSAQPGDWASWADALAMINQRNPGVANLVVRTAHKEVVLAEGPRCQHPSRP